MLRAPCRAASRRISFLRLSISVWAFIELSSPGDGSPLLIIRSNPRLPQLLARVGYGKRKARPIAPMGSQTGCVRQLQQTFQQQPHLAQLGAVVVTFERQHVDREGAVVVDAGQLLDEFAVVDFTLADADVQLVLRRIAQVYVLHVLHHLVDARAAVWA